MAAGNGGIREVGRNCRVVDDLVSVAGSDHGIKGGVHGYQSIGAGG